MSVVVRGMEMPENCGCCPFPTVRKDVYYCQCPTMEGKKYDFRQAESRPKDCPLFELKDWRKA